MKLRMLFRSIELISRVLCVFIVLDLYLKHNLLAKFSLLDMYDFSSALYYIVLLITIVYISRKGRKTGFVLITIEKFLRYLKWIFVLETIFLLSVRSIVVNEAIGAAKLKPVDISSITTPNMGFIIITLLSFFISAVLKEYNKIKEEQNLTI